MGRLTERATVRGMLRVPEITIYFWIVKGLSTAMGESTSDYFVHRLDPVPAVLLGFVGFVLALALQIRMRRYAAWTYWFAVVMVGVFGTMCADVLHVGFGIPYAASTTLCLLGLAVVFWLWQRTEHTLSIHSIDSDRRELFYWAAVVADVRARHRPRRPDRDHLQPRLLPVDRAVRGAARDPRGRILAPALESHPVVLARVRPDPAARCIDRRLARQAPG